MTITIDTADRRSLEALALLDHADTWVKGHRTEDGKPFFVIRSLTSDRVYWTDTRDCTCPDRQRRGLDCKHILAVRLWMVRHHGQTQQPRRSPEQIAELRRLVAND